MKRTTVKSLKTGRTAGCLLFLLLPLSFLSARPVFTAESGRLVFTEYYLKESPPQPGLYLDASLEDEEFILIDEKKEKWPLDPSLTKRMYTLHIELILDTVTSQKDLAIFTGPANYPYDVYINGTFLTRQGRYAENRSGSVYKSLASFIPPHLLNPGGVNRLSLQCFPEIDNTPVGGIFIATAPIATRYAFIRNLWNITGPQGIVFSCMVLALYFFFLFSRGKLADKQYLYFALLCFFFSFSYVNMAFCFDFANALVLDKLSRVGFTLSAGLLCLLGISFTGILDRFRFLKPVLYAPSVINAFILFMSRDKWVLHRFFTGVTTKYLIPLYMVLSIVIFGISAIKDKNRQSAYVLPGMAGIVLTGLWDTRLLTSGSIPYFWSLPYGYTALLVSIFFILARKQAETHHKLIDREKSLNQRNSEMAALTQKLSTISGGLITSYNQLGKIIDTSAKVIKDYEESNNSIMAGAISRFDDLENIINRIRTMIENSSQRIPTALGKQNSVIDRIRGIIREINSNLEATLTSSSESNQVAESLAELAADSSGIIQQSKAFITRIEDYAKFINNILITINTITAKTNIVSINAAIEAARVEDETTGFALVAKEISNLAKESGVSLNASFKKIQELSTVVEKNHIITEQVDSNLQEIIGQARLSADNLRQITRMIRTQQQNSSSILQSLDHFLKEIAAIKAISTEIGQENQEDQSTLGDLKEAFLGITDQLKDQIRQGAELQGSLKDIQQVMAENIQTAGQLKKSAV